MTNKIIINLSLVNKAMVQTKDIHIKKIIQSIIKK